MTSDSHRTIDEAEYNAMSEVISAAHHWWISKRPINWVLSQHLEAPLVNVTSESEAELAELVAKWVRLSTGEPT